MIELFVRVQTMANHTPALRLSEALDDRPRTLLRSAAAMPVPLWYKRHHRAAPTACKPFVLCDRLTT